MQPSLRLRCIGVICHFQAVVAVGLVLSKCAVQEIRAVRHMNTVCFHGQRRRVCHELQTGKQIGYCLGNAVCQTSTYFIQYHLADLALILNDAVNGEQAATDTFHGMKLQEMLTEQDFVDVLTVKPERPLIVLVHSFIVQNLFFVQILFPPCSLFPDRSAVFSAYCRSSSFQ